MPRAFTSCWPVAELIGAVGLITNSQVLIVAAMVVGPEYYAIIAVALGISSRDRSAVRDGLLALLWGFLAPIAVTLLFGLASGDRGRPRRCSWPSVRPVADFINTPRRVLIVVAGLAGIVGVVSLTYARANALIGVFISVTTIPAAASIGMSIAFSSWGERGSGLQLLLNVVVLMVAGAGRRTAQRRFWQDATEQP